MASAAAGFLAGRRRFVKEEGSSDIPSAAIPDLRTTLYRELAENIRQVFWMADCREERLIYISPAVLDLWLVEPQRMINDPTEWFAFIHPADRPNAEATLASMLAGAASSCEYRIIRPDGNIRAVRNRSFPIKDHEGVITRVAGIVEDVTSEQDAQRALRESRDELVRHVNQLKGENRERRRAETELRAAKELAEAGNRAKSRFLRNISHELRTPLNGIMGMLQIALDADDSTEERQSLQSATQSAAHLLAIVDDILQFSESESGRIEIAREPFDIRKCVRDTVSRLVPHLPEKNLTFAYYVSVAVPEIIIGDGKRLAQILGHLFSNAVKFSESGSICLEVTRADLADGTATLRFAVSDTGIGIPQENRKAIFEAFTQVDGSLTRSYGGLGLGLSICSRLVALMGGEMSVESEPGQGSRFIFSVPLGAATAAPDPSLRGALTGKSVLLIDSAPGRADIAARALSDAGLEVTRCRTAQAAEKEIADVGLRLGAVLMGAGLIDADVCSVAERLSKQLGLGHQLFLMLDGQPEPSLYNRLRGMQIAGIFSSPLNFDDVREAIRKVQPATSLPSSRPAKTIVKSPVPEVPPLRVLLVEDNPINQTVLKRMLQKQGHAVVTADNGRIALDTLGELDWDIDLVLMDMQMPELDGYEATACIRAMESERGGHLPIIAVTAHAMAGDSERCLSAGMDAYVTNPIQMEVLARAISGLEGLTKPALALERKVS